MRYGIANPAGKVFGRWIKIEFVVQVLVIKLVLYNILDMLKVYNHTIGIQLLGCTIDGYDTIVTMQVGTLALVRKRKLVSKGYLETLANVIQCSKYFFCHPNYLAE